MLLPDEALRHIPETKNALPSSLNILLYSLADKGEIESLNTRLR